MKHKLPSKWVETHLPPDWWKHPVFDFGIHYPMPYIWFAYWLITWEEVEDPWTNVFKFIYIPPQFTRLYKYLIQHRIRIATQGFSFIRISISFLPD